MSKKISQPEEKCSRCTPGKPNRPYQPDNAWLRGASQANVNKKPDTMRSEKDPLRSRPYQAHSAHKAYQTAAKDTSITYFYILSNHSSGNF